MRLRHMLPARAARAAAGAIDAERTAEREAAVLEAQAKIDDLLLKQEAAVRRRDERKRLKDEAEAAVRNARLPGAATRDPKRVQKLEAAVAERKAKFLTAERELRIQMHKVADAEAADAARLHLRVESFLARSLRRRRRRDPAAGRHRLCDSPRPS